MARPARRMPSSLEKVGEPREIDVAYVTSQIALRRHAFLADRRHPVVEPRGAAVQPAASTSVIASLSGSQSTAPRRFGKRQSFTPASGLVNVPFSSRPALEEMERALEVPLAGGGEAIAWKKMSFWVGKSMCDLMR